MSEVAGTEASGAALPREVAASTQDALQLLRADHRRIDALLSDCARLAGARSSSRADRSGLLMRLGALLLAHAQIEKELFYPAWRLHRWPSAMRTPTTTRSRRSSGG